MFLVPAPGNQPTPVRGKKGRSRRVRQLGRRHLLPRAGIPESHGARLPPCGRDQRLAIRGEAERVGGGVDFGQHQPCLCVEDHHLACARMGQEPAIWRERHGALVQISSDVQKLRHFVALALLPEIPPLEATKFRLVAGGPLLVQQFARARQVIVGERLLGNIHCQDIAVQPGLGQIASGAKPLPGGCE